MKVSTSLLSLSSKWMHLGGSELAVVVAYFAESLPEIFSFFALSRFSSTRFEKVVLLFLFSLAFVSGLAHTMSDRK